ncbi:MAG: hypothetical protein HZY76_15190 [Anaerolineae bacterium]|nr:MAG: hypothetical protein HZY76_15190 [Anaerolineae bacterium]
MCVHQIHPAFSSVFAAKHGNLLFDGLNVTEQRSLTKEGLLWDAEEWPADLEACAPHVDDQEILTIRQTYTTA